MRDIEKIATEDLVKIVDVLSNDIFQFNCKANQQKSDTAIGAKFAPY